jgi:hypothetical protein
LLFSAVYDFYKRFFKRLFRLIGLLLRQK